MTMRCLFVVVLLACSLNLATGFAPSAEGLSKSSLSRSSSLHMAPKFDKTTQTWSATKPEEEPSAGYGPLKTLLLAGPKPFFIRVFKPQDYEQAVLKFLASEKCSRDVAQGNMDAYLENPNDWAYNRLYAEKRGFEIDYVNIKTNQIVLTLAWSSVVLLVAGRAGVSLSTGENFWNFLIPFMNK